MMVQYYLHTNKAIHEMFAVAENDIRKDLPAVLRGGCWGPTSISSTRIRPISAACWPNSPGSHHRATIKVGRRTFLLTVTPVTNDRGQRLGLASRMVTAPPRWRVEGGGRRHRCWSRQWRFFPAHRREWQAGFFLTLANDINRLLETSQRGLEGRIAKVLGAPAEGDHPDHRGGLCGDPFGRRWTTPTLTGLSAPGHRKARSRCDGGDPTAAKEISIGQSGFIERTEERMVWEETASRHGQRHPMVKQNADNAGRQRAGGTA